MEKIYRTRRKRDRQTRARRGQIFRSRLTALLTVLLFGTVLGIVGVVVASFAVYRSYAHDLQAPQDAITSKFVGPSIAYDRNGQKLGDYIDPNAGLRDPVPINEISSYLIAATVATEDASFYTNPGVNFSGLARAAWENLTPFGGGGFFGGSGGSSITQQLVKNVYFPCVAAATCPENTGDKVNRKLKESVIAVELKRKYNDDQILDWYLNQIYYGRFSYGIEAASEQFFGKKASELDLAEASYLAGLPQAPGTYNLYPDRAALRQQEVLDLMIKHLDDINKIPTDGDDTKPLLQLTADDINAARTEPLQLKDATFSIQAPHFFLYLQDQVTKMCQAGLFRAPGDIPCDQVVTSGGLRITSTLDLGLNSVGQQIMEDQLAANEDHTNGHDASIVAIDPKTGEILAYLGSRNFYYDVDPDSELGRQISPQVDIASSLQSLGSTMKMYTYLTAFEQGWVPSTYIEDAPLTLDVGGQQRPVNNWNFSYLGNITVRKAMSESVNTAAVRALQAVGEDQMRAMAHRMGITDLRQGNCGPTITLGACEVQLVDQTFAFSVLANNGVMKGRPTSEDLPTGYRELDQVSVLQITDVDGNVIYKFDAPEQRQIVDPAYAYMVTDVLSNDGITWSRLTIDRPAATKTGTSEEFRDAVVMGYTPDLTVGVWMGNADNSKMADGTFSAQGVGPMWREFTEQASAYLNLPADKFTKPDDAVYLSCGGRQEVFKANTPTVKNGACHGPSAQGTASPTPKGPVFPTQASQTPTPATSGSPSPTATTKPPQVYYYITREGDTIESVAALFDILPSDLMKANGLTEGTELTPGTVLVIPGGVHPLSPTPTAPPEEGG
ncbi:MAG TPA: transglycosylase domain-containing protein [Dehalococcoidia bacterium]|nr:transglycosylase domain-containing protein [Dehalococcoidia bacterium]